jgi:CDP-diacylglycerol--serine O-phosphatidyltransferase
MPMKIWRYAVPNAITAVSLTFAVLSIMNATSGQYVAAAWFGLYCVLTDKLDGFAARGLGGSSAFGVQFDSFADFLSFGIAPATLWYCYLSHNPELGFAQPGVLRVALQLATVIYILAVAFRLARFNVGAPVGGTKVYLGVPTTLLGGTLMSLFVTFLKYGDPAHTGLAQSAFGGPWLLGRHTELPVETWRLWPLLMVAGAYLMLSSLKVPKLGLTPNRAANAIVILNIAGVYGFGAMQWMPEYLAGVGTAYMIMSVIYGLLAQSAREIVRPRLFAPPGGSLAEDDDEED